MGRFVFGFLLACSLASLTLSASGQTTAQGQSLWTQKGCSTSGCHHGNPPNIANGGHIEDGRNWTAVQDASRNGDPAMVAALAPGLTEFEAKAASCYIQSWTRGGVVDPWCSGAVQAPSCTISVSNASPAVGSNVTLTATCTNSPTNYAWTNCASTTSTCTVAATTAGSQTYAVQATNGGGTSAPASATIDWRAAAPQAPSCALSASTTTPAVGDSVTLTANCTNAPTGYAWTNCASTTSTCIASGTTAGTQTYSVRASNAGGTSTSASVSVDWRPVATGNLRAPASVLFADQPVGTRSASRSASLSNTGTAPVAITGVSNDNAAEFPVIANDCVGTLNPGASCSIVFEFAPSAAGPRSANVVVSATGGATRFLVVGAGVTSSPAGGSNYTGLYWNSPGGSEDGWGMNVAHQGDVMFVTWFTYDASRKGWWLVMLASRIAEGVYSGDVLETRGPPFSTVPFNPSGDAVTNVKVGTATLNFVAPGGSTFAFTVNGTTMTKRIERQPLGPGALPVCTFGGGDQAAATNFTDLWWAAPWRSEDGWGINLTHQGDVIFGTWFTYDVDRTPMWLFVTATRTGAGAYAGQLYRTTGTPYNASSYSGFAATPVGSLTFTFTNGASATMSYTITGVGPAPVTQTKALMRQVLIEPGIVCR